MFNKLFSFIVRAKKTNLTSLHIAVVAASMIACAAFVILLAYVSVRTKPPREPEWYVDFDYKCCNLTELYLFVFHVQYTSM